MKFNFTWTWGPGEYKNAKTAANKERISRLCLIMNLNKVLTNLLKIRTKTCKVLIGLVNKFTFE